jgi:hypothetical protein
MTTAPMNPLAGASGPGKYSVRSDKLDMGSTSYGEGVETQALKSGAPLATTPDVRGARAGDVREAATKAPQEPVTELFAPTQRPSEPITAGIAMGAGAGPEALVMKPQMTEKYSDTLAKLLPYDESGEIAILYQDMLARGM